MPISSHTTSLELSLALREAGYPQDDALFYWYKRYLTDEWELVPSSDFPDDHSIIIGEIVASPLASEILEVLPRQVHGKYLNITKAEDDGYYVTYGEGDYGGEHKPILANALGKLFLHLRKASLI